MQDQDSINEAVDQIYAVMNGTTADGSGSEE